MPKRKDIKKILLIGSGPIIIGQACEFDYAGVQACKALKEEGYDIVLVNSNPASIMTDPEFSSHTYIEPLNVDTIHAIICRERPDALLPTLGGQTSLNLTIRLDEEKILEQYQIEVIGAKVEVIRKAEDREQFKEAVKRIGLDTPESIPVHSMKEAESALKQLQGLPVVIRPGFTLGGTGGGIARTNEDFEAIVSMGLSASLNQEVLIEESIIGWKEFELELMRDKKNNSVIVCSIENLDPMGVHTGDSITVSPAQTLTDREYQRLRDSAFAIMAEIGVETGGANVQFALDPQSERMLVIEMNPRVSRSSALASKATGFPIAKIAAKLAVGYTLDELTNDITQKTIACFEPAIDYIVTKIPRFNFEKFPMADDTLDTQMKSVGEVMGIGRTFKQSLQKAMRSLETGRSGFGSDGKDEQWQGLSKTQLEKLLTRPNEQRLFAIRVAFQQGWSVEMIYQLTHIDRWFLNHLQELSYYEIELQTVETLENLNKNPRLFRQAKEFGYSDQQLAFLLNTSEEKVYQSRQQLNLLPIYSLVDTCAAEFPAHTPYYYSNYGEYNEQRPSRKPSIMIIGSGPNRIGQGIEFDYCCVHAAFALRELGFEILMVNSNPETVSTDYDTSDKLYFEPLTLEDILPIYHSEKCSGAIIQFGGQTPLNLARGLQKHEVKILGTSPDSIELCEDRKRFQNLIHNLQIKQPENDTAFSAKEALSIAKSIGYPILVRPSFVLGGRAMTIAHTDDFLRQYATQALRIAPERPILIERYLNDAIEIDVDCISDGCSTVIGAIIEHVEQAGIHSGDSACIIPASTLPEAMKERIRQDSYALAKELEIIGLMNIQYAIQDDDIYIIEANPRASRTIPYVSKSIGVPLAKLAASVMVGKSLKELGFTQEIIPDHYSVKEAVFPFDRFPGIDISLTPEMKSTGEVMGIDSSAGLAYLKAQEAAKNPLPRSGSVFISVRDSDKADTIKLARRLVTLQFSIYATKGTCKVLGDAGITSTELERISSGNSPNILDMLKEKKVKWIINTTSTGANPHLDEIRMRSAAILHNIPIATTIRGFDAGVAGLEALRKKRQLTVCSLQEYHDKVKKAIMLRS